MRNLFLKLHVGITRQRHERFSLPQLINTMTGQCHSLVTNLPTSRLFNELGHVAEKCEFWGRTILLKASWTRRLPQSIEYWLYCESFPTMADVSCGSRSSLTVAKSSRSGDEIRHHLWQRVQRGPRYSIALSSAKASASAACIYTSRRRDKRAREVTG